MNLGDALAIGLTVALLALLSLAYLYPHYAGGLLIVAMFVSLADGYVIHKYSSDLSDFREFERAMLDVKEYLLQALQSEGSKYTGLVEELIKVEQSLLSGLTSARVAKERARGLVKK
jgi:hypothetical protein